MNISARIVHIFWNDLRTAYVGASFTNVVKISQRGQGWETFFTNVIFIKGLIPASNQRVKITEGCVTAANRKQKAELSSDSRRRNDVGRCK